MNTRVSTNSSAPVIQSQFTSRSTWPRRCVVSTCTTNGSPKHTASSVYKFQWWPWPITSRLTFSLRPCPFGVSSRRLATALPACTPWGFACRRRSDTRSVFLPFCEWCFCHNNTCVDKNSKYDFRKQNTFTYLLNSKIPLYGKAKFTSTVFWTVFVSGTFDLFDIFLRHGWITP